MKASTAAVLMSFGAFLTGDVNATTTFGKTCPTVDVAPILLKDLYAGRWYEIQRDGDTPYEWMADCVTATYTATTDGYVKAVNRAWYW